jgi:hypothetical protein
MVADTDIAYSLTCGGNRFHFGNEKTGRYQHRVYASLLSNVNLVLTPALNYPTRFKSGEAADD